MSTNTKPEVQVDVKPVGTQSAVVYAPFNEALDALKENGYELISLAQNAQLRIQQGTDSYISRNGNWTREGVIYTPKKKPRLVRNSPILYSPQEATQAHRNGKEFYPTEERVLEALEDSVEFPSQDMEIPTDRFGSEDLTVFAFGGDKEARKYGEFLRNAGIKKMPVYAVSKDNVNSQTQPFARQMWFGNLDYRSGLYGYYGGLGDDYWVRGVKTGAEGTAQNSAEGYNPKTIAKALKDLGLSGLEQTLLAKLKQ